MRALPEEADLAWIANVSGARGATKGERIQSLWSGYGEIFRVGLQGGERASVVVKSVVPPPLQKGSKPSLSHARKCRSYDVEAAFYRTFAPRCDDACRVPSLLAARKEGSGWLFVLEDLDSAGFPDRARGLDDKGQNLCIAWLAAFHAKFLGVAPTDLWKTGTYWHLATRPDELAALDDDLLRGAAPEIDRRLGSALFRTFVHGDAKPANFCFSKDRGAVAAVDFQYVGGGAGVKDVAYLLACKGDPHPSSLAPRLDTYFRLLRRALGARRETFDVDALEAEWRGLFPLAIADFYRFLAGWSKGAWRSEPNARRWVTEIVRGL